MGVGLEVGCLAGGREGGGLVKRKEDVDGFGQWGGEGRVAMVWSQLNVLAEYFPSR